MVDCLWFAIVESFFGQVDASFVAQNVEAAAFEGISQIGLRHLVRTDVDDQVHLIMPMILRGMDSAWSLATVFSILVLSCPELIVRTMPQTGRMR
jgi:hypothetical protein